MLFFENLYFSKPNCYDIKPAENYSFNKIVFIYNLKILIIFYLLLKQLILKTSHYGN